VLLKGSGCCSGVLGTGRVKVSPRGSGCCSGVSGTGRVKVSLRGSGCCSEVSGQVQVVVQGVQVQVGLMLVWVQGFWIT